MCVMCIVLMETKREEIKKKEIEDKERERKMKEERRNRGGGLKDLHGHIFDLQLSRISLFSPCLPSLPLPTYSPSASTLIFPHLLCCDKAVYRDNDDEKAEESSPLCSKYSTYSESSVPQSLDMRIHTYSEA
jgi:hypothetical protein